MNSPIGVPLLTSVSALFSCAVSMRPLGISLSAAQCVTLARPDALVYGRLGSASCTPGSLAHVDKVRQLIPNRRQVYALDAGRVHFLVRTLKSQAASAI